MKGRRVPDGEFLRVETRPGDFGKVTLADGSVRWFTWPPGCEHPGTLKRFGDDDSPMFHEVEEHDDGTITVRPSILHHGKVLEMQAAGGSINDGGNGWHGFLERGVWRQV